MKSIGTFLRSARQLLSLIKQGKNANIANLPSPRKKIMFSFHNQTITVINKKVKEGQIRLAAYDGTRSCFLNSDLFFLDSATIDAETLSKFMKSVEPFPDSSIVHICVYDPLTAKSFYLQNESTETVITPEEFAVLSEDRDNPETESRCIFITRGGILSAKMCRCFIKPSGNVFFPFEIIDNSSKMNLQRFISDGNGADYYFALYFTADKKTMLMPSVKDNICFSDILDKYKLVKNQFTDNAYVCLVRIGTGIKCSRIVLGNYSGKSSEDLSDPERINLLSLDSDYDGLVAGPFPIEEDYKAFRIKQNGELTLDSFSENQLDKLRRFQTENNISELLSEYDRPVSASDQNLFIELVNEYRHALLENDSIPEIQFDLQKRIIRNLGVMISDIISCEKLIKENNQIENKIWGATEDLLSLIDDDIVLKGNVPTFTKLFLLKLKHGQPFEIKEFISQIRFCYGETGIWTLGNMPVIIDSIQINNSILHIEGHSFFPESILDKSPELIVYINRKKYTDWSLYNYQNNYFFDKIYSKGICFKLDIPLDAASRAVQFGINYSGYHAICSEIQFSKTTDFVSITEDEGICLGHYHIRSAGNTIICQFADEDQTEQGNETEKITGVKNTITTEEKLHNYLIRRNTLISKEYEEYKTSRFDSLYQEGFDKWSTILMLNLHYRLLRRTDRLYKFNTLPEYDINQNFFFDTVDQYIKVLDGNEFLSYSEFKRTEIYNKIISNLCEMITNVSDTKNIYEPDLHIDPKYWDLLQALLLKIEDSFITHSGYGINMKMFLLRCKYKRQFDYQEFTEKIRFCYGDTPVWTFGAGTCMIDITEIRNGELTVEGCLHISGAILDFEPEIVAFINSKAFTTIPVNRYTDRYVFDKLYSHDRGFSLTIPLTDRHYSIRIGLKCKGYTSICGKMRFSDISPVTNEIKNSYYYKNGYAVTVRKNIILCNECKNGETLLAFEDKLRQRIRLLCSENAEEIISLRNHYWKNRIQLPGKNQWILLDRSDRADDNAEALFRHTVQTDYPNTEPSFILLEEAAQFPELAEVGNVIPFKSKEHLQKFLTCKYVISSQLSESTINPFENNFNYFRDIIRQKKFIFLQHGVTYNNNGPKLGRYGRNFYGFITSGYEETDYLRSEMFHYSDDNIWLTGMPRFDRLYDDDQRTITIMPTWRKELTKRTYDEQMKTHIWKVKDDFCDSEYFKFYNALINDENLIRAARDNHYNIMFMPHVQFLKMADSFENRNPDVLSICTYDIRYRDLFAMSSLILTDYTSAVFDFAYMHKPVVYCQFDKDEFYKHHTVKRGYFDTERDGFGEVTETLDATVNLLISYMKNNCQMKEEYINRVNRFFKYTDHNCCKRICDKIFELEIKNPEEDDAIIGQAFGNLINEDEE